MRLGITIGRPKGKKHFVVLTGPDVSLGKQKAEFKEKQGDVALGEKFEEIQLWSSTRGVLKRHRPSGESKVNADAMLSVREQRAALESLDIEDGDELEDEPQDGLPSLEKLKEIEPELVAAAYAKFEPMTVALLKGELELRGLDHTGVKDDLVNRLVADEALVSYDFPYLVDQCKVRDIDVSQLKSKADFCLALNAHEKAKSASQ